MDPSWSAVFPVVAYNVWKYYNCTACLENAWPGLQLYYKMLAANYSVSSHTFGKWGGCASKRHVYRRAPST